MTDREAVYRGLSHAAWGYFLLTFDFNLGTVSVLPRFAGFLLLFSAIGKLSGEQRDLALLRPLCVLLALWSFVDWCLSWTGGDLDGEILFLDLLVAVAGLYFHFQFLTDMASLAEERRGEEEGRRIRRHRTAYVLLVTIAGLIVDLDLPGEWSQWLALGSAAAACIVALCVMADLFRLRRDSGAES